MSYEICPYQELSNVYDRCSIFSIKRLTWAKVRIWWPRDTKNPKPDLEAMDLGLQMWNSLEIQWSFDVFMGLQI